MAFCSRIGSLVRNSISANGLSNGPTPLVPLLNSVRYASTKLFVGGLSFSTDDQSLRDAFINFGDLVEARVITDRDSGRSRGFGFVNFVTDEAASSALSGMDGKELHGRHIRVSYANERPSSPMRSSYGGGYGGGSGGYGGGFGSGAGAE